MPTIEAIKAALATLTEALVAHEAEVAAQVTRIPTLADLKAMIERIL